MEYINSIRTPYVANAVKGLFRRIIRPQKSKVALQHWPGQAPAITVLIEKLNQQDTLVEKTQLNGLIDRKNSTKREIEASAPNANFAALVVIA